MPYNPGFSENQLSWATAAADVVALILDIKKGVQDGGEANWALTDVVRADAEKAILDSVAVAVDVLLLFKQLEKELPLVRFTPVSGLIISLENFIEDVDQVLHTSGEDDHNQLGHALIILSDGFSTIGNGLDALAQIEIGVPILVAGAILNAFGNYLIYENPPTPDHGPQPHPSAPPSKHDPLVLDLTGNGINLTALAGSPAYFDYTGSGIPQKTGWITAGEGLLVLAPADGKTVTAADLLGAYSGNGFADLAALDSNGDGVINASDAAYSQLRVWVSTDGSTGELLTLAQPVGYPAIFQIPCRRAINRQKPATSFRHPALWARPCSTFPASSSASAAAPFLTKRRPSCRHAVASG